VDMSTPPAAYYHRNLPHWHPPGVPLFFTCRLHGSLPAKVMQELKSMQRLLAREISTLSEVEQQKRRVQAFKRTFARIDVALDKAASGPLWLVENQIAAMVENTLISKYAELYKLWAYVVMANHIHFLITPKSFMGSDIPVPLILQKIKGYTAYEANKMLGRTGEPFWQGESFDHWPRDDDEFMRIVAYIENNPVKAGLVKRPEDWKYSSAAERKRRGWSTVRSLT
ncbi:MAG TPA: transposase, partial [Pyrinomonadaceae bacterium]|nr:transposase [Pyrinomonadaceae bacterium]